MSKIRPCIIASPDELNDALNTVIIAPLTTTLKKWSFRPQVRVLGRVSGVACDQIRAIDKARLRDALGNLTTAECSSLSAVLQTMFS